MVKYSMQEKLNRYLKNVSEEKEDAELFSDFFDNCPELLKFLEEDWNAFMKDKIHQDINLDHIHDRIHHIIRNNEEDEKQRPIKRILRAYMKIAAVLLIPLLIGGVIFFFVSKPRTILADLPVNTSIYAPLGSRVKFSLPDGTLGTLNSGSQLSYSLPFSNSRKIKLEGEAWFEVKHDAENPFEIDAGNSKIRVLGTSFNLSAYPAENYIEVVLKEGNVEFTEDSTIVSIKPSERLVYRDGKISKNITDPAKYNSWKDGKLIFREDPMAEVARRIERWYNVKVTLADSELEKYSFRGTFEDDKLEDVMMMLAMTSPITYKIIPGKLLADGTHEKTAVTIRMKKQPGNI